MASENPIKHKDIIDQGNPFDETIKGLEEMIKLFNKLEKEIKTTAKELLKFTKKQTTATKEGKKNISAAAKATAQLSEKEKEAIKVKKALARERAKLAQMDTPEFKALVKAKEATRAKAAEMRKAERVMRTGIKTTNKWSKALGSFAFKFNALGNIAANVMSRITRGINRGMREAIKVVVDFDRAMADVKAITGATGKEFDKLSKSAKALGGITKFTASEVAGLQKAYAKLGFTTEEILKAQAATLDLAAATNTDLAEAAEVAGITVRQFSLDASETQRVVDVMARSFTTSALDMEKFRESMKFVGPAARASNISLERTTAMLAQLADAGISGSMAGTSLRGIMLGLAKESGTLGEKIERLSEKGLTLASATDEVQRRAATALIVLGNGVDTIDDFTDALEGAAGAARDMALIQLDTLAGKATLVKSAWEKMILTFIETENGLGGIKHAFDTIILTLDALAIKAETGFNFSTALGIAKAVTDANAYIDHIDRSNKQLDMLLGGFSKIGGWMKELGQDLWEQMFPKESSPVEELESVADIIERLNKIFDEQRFEEDDNWFWNIGGALDTSVGDEILSNLEAMLEQKRQMELGAIRQADADMEEAEKLKQAKIQETFDIANRLTSTFTSLFAAQQQRELAAFDSKQERMLLAAGDNAEQRKAIAERLAKEREEIEKKFGKRQQVLGISQAIMDGALALQKVQANIPPPANIPFLIASAALTAAQIGIIASQKFAEGGSGLLGDSGGVLQGRSHSMGGVNLGDIGEAERGEYFGIVNRNMARKYSDELPMVFDSLNNGAFHEVWNRRRASNNIVVQSDPNIRRMREMMENTPIFVPEGKRHERYPDGRQRIING